MRAQLPPEPGGSGRDARKAWQDQSSADAPMESEATAQPRQQRIVRRQKLHARHAARPYQSTRSDIVGVNRLIAADICLVAQGQPHRLQPLAQQGHMLVALLVNRLQGLAEALLPASSEIAPISVLQSSVDVEDANPRENGYDLQTQPLFEEKRQASFTRR